MKSIALALLPLFVACNVPSDASNPIEPYPGQPTERPADLDPNVNEHDFAARWAAEWCTREKECDPNNHEGKWEGARIANCVTAKVDQAGFKNDWQDLTCAEFDAVQAASCLESMHDMSCTDWAAKDWRRACKLVYGCGT